MAVSYSVLHVGPLKFGEDGAECKMVYEIAGSDVLNWINERFDPDYVDDLGFVIKKRVRHPLYDWMVVRELEIDNFLGERSTVISTEEPSWNYKDDIRVTETYRGDHLLGSGWGGIGSVEMVANRYLVHRREGTGSMQDLPGYAFKWWSDNEAVSPDVAVGIVVSKTVHHIDWYCLPSIPSGIAACLGKVNSGNVTLGGLTLPDCQTAETLLFESWFQADHYDANGSLVYDLHYVLVEKALEVDGVYKGWNHFYREGNDPEWDKLVQHGGSGEPPYRLKDLQDLFTLP